MSAALSLGLLGDMGQASTYHARPPRIASSSPGWRTGYRVGYPWELSSLMRTNHDVSIVPMPITQAIAILHMEGMCHGYACKEQDR